MANIKEIWKKMKYWQKGALCGFLLGILIYLFIGIYRNNVYLDDSATWLLLFLFLPDGLRVFISWNLDSILAYSTLSSSLSLFLWHVILGSLFYTIYYYITQKLIRKKVLGLFLTIISFLLIIFILNFCVAILIFSRAA